MFANVLNSKNEISHLHKYSDPLLSTCLMSRPDLREMFYFSIWLGQGVMWGGHSMFCISVAECGSQSEAAVYRCL
jgi:hypothetical protein